MDCIHAKKIDRDHVRRGGRFGKVESQLRHRGDDGLLVLLDLHSRAGWIGTMSQCTKIKQQQNAGVFFTED
jgi:hypothetical protein